MGRVKDFKESFLEVLWITKACLTTFWYWLPISFMAYILVQLWMIFFVHPLTILILPGVMILYGTLLEEKRTRLRYGLGKRKQYQASHGLGATPEPMEENEWKVEQAVDQYKRLLREPKREEDE
jgi:type VI protein secretion system component VasK